MSVHFLSRKTAQDSDMQRAKYPMADFSVSVRCVWQMSVASCIRPADVA